MEDFQDTFYKYTRDALINRLNYVIKNIYSFEPDIYGNAGIHSKITSVTLERAQTLKKDYPSIEELPLLLMQILLYNGSDADLKTFIDTNSINLDTDSVNELLCTLMCTPNESNSSANSNSNSNSSFEYLLSLGAEPSYDENLPLKLAIYVRDLERIKLLVEYGIDINKPNDLAIQLAFSKNSIRIQKYLIDNGADLTKNLDLIIKYCRSSANTEAILLMINAGIDLKDHLFQIAQLAIQRYNDSLMRTCIELGVDLKKLDQEDLAMSLGRLEIGTIQLMIDGGVNFCTLNDYLDGDSDEGDKFDFLQSIGLEGPIIFGIFNDFS